MRSRFGQVNIFPVARLRGVTEPTCTVITDGPDSPPEADDWHTDVTWIAEPPNYALLSAQSCRAAAVTRCGRR